MGKQWKQWLTLFFWAPKSLQMVTAAMKIEEAYSLDFQHLLSEMESLKPKVHAVQVCQSVLRIPEDVVTSLPLCHAALHLQEEASRLQHTAIQQCNIMQACAAGPAGLCRRSPRRRQSSGK